MNRGNQAFQKAANAALVMREIRRREPVSRTEIAALLGLTKSTVSNIVAELLAAGLLTETDARSPGGNGTAQGRPEPRGGSEPRSGRPRKALSLRPEACCVLGIQLNPRRWEAVYLDLHGTTLAAFEGAFEAGAEAGFEAGAEGAFEGGANPVSRDGRAPVWLAQEAYDSVPPPPGGIPVIGVGVALPGNVEPIRGRIMRSTAFEAHDEEFAAPLAELLSVPVLAENDANCVAWGEIAADGTHQSRPNRNLLTVLLNEHRNASGGLRDSSPGIGCGLVVDGAVRYGAGFAAGELHSADWTASSPGQLSGATCSERNEAARDRKMLLELFSSLSVAVSLLSPERVIYAGDMLGRDEEIAALLNGELSAHFINPALSGTPVVPSRFGRAAVSCGAAAMFLERLFLIPDLDQPRPQGLPDWAALAQMLSMEPV